MSAHLYNSNRVAAERMRAGLSQAELAAIAGISRTGLSAIEGNRLAPAVDTAIRLARALRCTVEQLFAAPVANMATRWAASPQKYPCRYWHAEIAGGTMLLPVEASAGLPTEADGVANGDSPPPVDANVSQRTLVLATCDPAAGFLALEYARQTPFRMLVLSRTSRAAVELLLRGLVHVAGVHFAAADDPAGNAEALRRLAPEQDLQLLSVAAWQEGLAVATSSGVRTAKQAVKAARWIGRQPGAGARRCQDELLASRRSPSRVAADHRGVVDAVRAGWADVGVCVRLACEEGQIGFLPICEEQYDLCFTQRDADDPRLSALVAVLRSTNYRRALESLPGYRLNEIGMLRSVAASPGSP